MITLFWIIFFTFLVSLISFIGVLVLFLKENFLEKILLILVSFSAGALLGDAFFHLIPEAIEEAGNENGISNVFFYLICGFCGFFILEQFLKWHHHHKTSHPEIKSFSYLILVSDAFHNFIDGLIIAGSFIFSFPMGLITSLAVILHEIPQEIGDFAVLLYGGMEKRKALFLNFVSAIFALIGGIAGFFIFKKTGIGISFLLPFTAGAFIYVAASDLIPQIKEEGKIEKSVIHFIVFLAGLGFMLLLRD